MILVGVCDYLDTLCHFYGIYGNSVNCRTYLNILLKNLERWNQFLSFFNDFFSIFLQKKKQKTNMISSDEDDESDDEEKAREEMQGFIAVSITKVPIL